MKLQSIVLFSIAATAMSEEATFAPPEEKRAIASVRVDAPIALDGRLDEPAWSTAPAAHGFRQIDPKQGEPATSDTEVRVLYDDANLYIGAICHDPAGKDGVRVPDLRRDFDYYANDLLGISLDPFGDGRTAIAFQVNPFGALRDLQVFDDVLADREWDAVWSARTTRHDDRWIAEIAIPWSTFRYPADARQWGVNFVRIVRRSNELSGWSPWPRAYSPYRMPYAGTLQNVAPPPPRINIRVNPYTVARADSIGSRDARDVDVGGDLKWAITPSSVLDATVNTDFAQADVDRQVVNLSRFSVFSPEKRQFFLENASFFTLGDAATVHPFFTRRIGLDDSGQPLPIAAGLRYVDRTTSRSIGGMLLQTRGDDDAPASTFGIARFIGNIGSAHRVGGTVISRRDGDARTNTVFALDGFVRPVENVTVEAMLSRSLTTGDGGEGFGSHVSAVYRSNRGFARFRSGVVTEGYRADAGFIPRPNAILTSAGGWPAIRSPRWPKWIRAMEPDLFIDLQHRASDRKLEEARVSFGPLYLTLADGGIVRAYIDHESQRLESSFSPLPGLSIERGDYDFARYGITWTSDQSRRLRGSIKLENGGFYDGTRRLIDASITFAPSPRASFGVSWQQNALDGIGTENAKRTTILMAPEIRLALNPRLQLYSFYQSNEAAESASLFVRLSWEYRPLSYVYLVLNDRAVLDDGGFVTPFPRERQIILKFSLLRQL